MKAERSGPTPSPPQAKPAQFTGGFADEVGAATPSGANGRGASLGFRLDLAANVAGAGWSVLTQLVCVPFFIAFLGIEAYALFGFYLVLQAALQVLDLGLTPTVNREMARYTVVGSAEPGLLEMVRTMEAAYWIMGAVIGVALLTAAPYLALRWFHSSSIPAREVRRVFVLIAALAFLQWPVSFYQGGLMGLRRQVLFNAVNITALTLTYGGALIVLWKVEHSLTLFFGWLVLASGVRLALMATAFWVSVGSRPHLRIRPRLLGKVKGFAAGTAGIAVFAIAFSQADKLIVSKVLSLADFGYYSVASMMASGLVLIIGAIFGASYPRFAALLVAEPEKILDFYHECTQAMAVVVLPVAAGLAFFSRDIIQLWTRNRAVAMHAGPVAAFLVVGVAISALGYIPYALQLAHGVTSISLWVSGCAAIIMIPGIVVLTLQFGMLGAAVGTVILYAGETAAQVFITHPRFLPGAGWPWLLEVAKPLVVVLAVGGMARWVGGQEPLWMTVAQLGACCGLGFLGSLWLSPKAQKMLFPGIGVRRGGAQA